jgi:hypothetical protein
MCCAAGTGLVGASDRSGVLAGIEPAGHAGLITYVGVARVLRCAPDICIIDAHVTLARSEMWLHGGGGARPKGAAPSSAQVWMIRTALAEPIRVTLRRWSWRARCPPGRHFARDLRRKGSSALPIAESASTGTGEGATVPPEGARATAEARTPCQSPSGFSGVGRNGPPLGIVFKVFRGRDAGMWEILGANSERTGDAWPGRAIRGRYA